MHYRVLSRMLQSLSRRNLNALTAWQPVTSAYFGTSASTCSPFVLPPCYDTKPAIGQTRSANQLLLADVNLLWLQQKRCVKKKFGKKAKRESAKEEAEDDEEEEDSDDDAGEEETEDTKVINTTVMSLRLDAIGKTCFGMPRAKFEESFYSGLVRVNGERVGKKSYEVKADDEIDFIRGFNLENRDKLDINRANIIKVDDKAASSGRIRVTFRKTNNLTVDNYPNDPYESAL